MIPRRSAVSRATRVDVVLELQYRNAGHLLVSYCTNLSRGGMFVHTRDPSPPGTIVGLKLAVPNHEDTIELSGEVRWTRYEADSSGPAGMGLRFEGVDDILGKAIDEIIGDAQPMKIVLLGAQDLGSRHLAALIETLVKCDVKHLKLRPGVGSKLESSDLVIVDVEPEPARALELLAELAGLAGAPPVLALCSRDKIELREDASQHARVLSTPIESLELEESILQTLAQVSAAT